MLFNAIKVDMPNCSGQSVVWDGDEVENKRGPLILDSVNIQAAAAHVKGLCIEFLMPICVVLMIRPN
jgi:hypothetical protein